MSIPSAKWLIALFIGVTLIITLVLALAPVDEPVDTTPPPPALGPGPSLAPSVHAVVDPQTWVVAEDLSALSGDWIVPEGRHMAGSRLRLRTGSDGSLYPYHLRFEPGVQGKYPLDCGFYKRLEKEWRLAYCTGYDKERTVLAAHRLMLHVTHTKLDSLRLQVGNMLEIRLRRVK